MSLTEQVIEQIKRIEQEEDATECASAFYWINEQLITLYNHKIESNISSLNPRVQAIINDREKRIKERKKDIDLLNGLIEKEKELSSLEDSLNEKYQQLQQRLEEIKVLKEKKEELDKPENDFSRLDNEVTQIKLDNNDFAQRLSEMLQRVNGLLVTTDTALSKQLSQVGDMSKANLEKIKNQKTALLESLERQPLKTCSNELDLQLDQIIDEYNKYVVKINAIRKELDEISEKHQSQIEQYNKRFNVDKDIFGVVEEPEAFTKYVEQQLKSMEDVLNAFEGKIKELVEQRNDLPLTELYNRQTSNINDNTN